MNVVQDETVADRRVGSFFKSDPTLAFKIVRIANVAPMGLRTIESVEHAVAIVGRSRATTARIDAARIPSAFRDAIDWAATVSRKL